MTSSPWPLKNHPLSERNLLQLKIVMTPRPRLLRHLYKTGHILKGYFPLISNTISGCGLFLFGDAIEQKLEMRRHQKRFDWERFQRIGIIGLLEAPPHYFFYKYLDIYFPGTGKVTIVKKIFIDQIVTSPCFSLQFFIGMSLLEGKSWKESWGEFVKKFPMVFIFDCVLWPPFQVVNFYYLPPHYRLLYVNVVTVIWNVFLSYMKHYDAEHIPYQRDTHTQTMKPNAHTKSTTT